MCTCASVLQLVNHTHLHGTHALRKVMDGRTARWASRPPSTAFSLA